MNVCYSSLIALLLLIGCSAPNNTFSHHAEDANWAVLSNPTSLLNYQDLSPLLNKAHLQQAKGIVQSMKTIEDASLIQAHIALLEGNHHQAYQLIQSEMIAPKTPLQSQLFFDIYRKSNHVSLALEHANTEQTGNLLNNQSIANLRQLPSFNEDITAWRDLFLALKKHEQLPEELFDQLQSFKKDHPNHNALKLLNLSKPSESAIVKMGVLLPLSGPMADAGQSIREGIMAAHFNSPLKKDWTLLFFDTNQIPVSEIIRSGENNHITHWIGPLDKNHAQQFADLARNSDHVLLLNTIDSQPSNVRSFALRPEDESIQISEYLIQSGYQNVLIFEGKHPWSSRQTQSFINDFTQQGGKVIATVPLTEKYADDVKEILQIPQSQHQYQLLQKQTSVPIKFIASARQDLDAIFLAVDHDEAIQVMPLLKLNLTQLPVPVFATSSIINDRANIHRNKDLDGIIFCDGMIKNTQTSTSALQEQIRSLMSELQSANSQKFNGLQQFFALGIDAYHLQLYKHYLDFTPSLGIPGASGKWLTLDSNQIKTKLYWGQYQQGQKINITQQLD